MEKNKLQNALKELHEVKLTSDEKSSMKASMKMKIFHVADRGLFVDPIRSPFQSLLGIFDIEGWMNKQNFTHPTFYLVAIIILLTGGGITLASGRSLPGDALYSLKVDVVEPIKSAFIATPISRAVWDTKLVSTRLSEAEALAVEGKLDNSKQQQISTLIGNSVTDFKQSIDEVKAGSSLEADMLNVSLQAHIDAHAKILNSINNTLASSTVSSSTPSIYDKKFDKKQKDNEDKKSSIDLTDKTFHEQQNKIQKNIDKTYVAPTTSTSTTTATTTTTTSKNMSLFEQSIINDARSSLDEAKSSLKQAEVKHNAGDTNGAYSALLNSESYSTEAKVILDNGMKYKEKDNSVDANYSTSAHNSTNTKDVGNADKAHNVDISGDTKKSDNSSDTKNSDSEVKIEYMKK